MNQEGNMDIQFYKVLHVTGAIMLFLSLGAAIVRSGIAGSSEVFKKEVSIMHGIAMVLLLVAGFGALAKLGAGFGGWVIVKLLIWLLLGGSIAIINRKPAAGKTLWYGCLALGLLAIYLAVYKPF
jgi:hypothetical protein